MTNDRTERTAITVIEKAPQASANTQACLVVIYGVDLGKRLILEPPTGSSVAGVAPVRALSVGRATGCEIHLDEDSVSRKHASFLIHPDGRVLVGDHQSTNGTYVNDRAIRGDTELRDGDLIKIGRTIFKYLTGTNIEAQYHEEIYKLTTTDGLTGIFNKRFFIETLEREMGRCYRYKRPLSIVMIDIDHFKIINDTHGHLAGDTVLRCVAQSILQNVRKEDVFARYGGEEFGIILPEVDTEGASQLAEKLRRVVEKDVYEWENKPVPVTISLGVCALPEEIVSPNEFVGRADQLLYEAKRSGRNKVVAS